MSEEKNLIGKEILNYRIESFIGGGGMGSVYLATNKHLFGAKAAIKVLNENLAESEMIRQKFVQEAQTLLSLDHSNIVHFLNFVENEEGIFLIMEYVDGITLDAFINQKQGLIPEKMAYPMFLQILDACAYAHKHGVIHRDIKPANIILTNDKDGNFMVKILDFGIAKIISESNEENDSEKGMIIGTPVYMSPEQVCGEDLDKRSDIYSLGVLLHQMLTGHAPYDTTTLSEMQIQQKVVDEPLPRMKEFYPAVSEKMQRIVDKATRKDKTKRYQTCGDFRTALKNAIDPDKLPKFVKYAATAFVLLLLGGGWWLYDYNYNVKTYFYKDYVEQWGVPVGIGKLSKTDVEQKIESYRFEKLKGKITRVSHVNSKGNIVEHHDSEHTERFDDMLLYYTDNGKLYYKKRLDRNGKVLYRMTYDENLKTANFTHDDDTKTEITLSASTTKLFASAFSVSNEKSNISKYLLTYDKNGYLTQIKYAGYRTSQVCDAEGIYGKKFVVDEKGRVIEEHYLGKDDAPKANKAGLAIKKLEYDNSNDFVKVSYFTANGEKGYDGNGCHICAVEYDKYGNRIKETYYDSEENITLRTDYKVAGFNYIVENGFMIQQIAFGVDETKCYVLRNVINENDDLFGFVSMKFDYDANGYTSRITYLDTEDKPVIIFTGIAVMELENDSKGNPVKHEFFDTENNPCENIYGFSKQLVEFDSVGNVTHVSYRNSLDAPCKTIDGIAGFKSEYDKNSKLKKQTFFGTDGQPCENTLSGVIIMELDYDERDDNLIKVTHYAANGKTLKLNNEGIAGWKSKYKDGHGLEIEREFFDTLGNLIAVNIGYARWMAKYDENGFLKEEAYFDKKNLPVVFYNPQTGFSYSKIEYAYDADRGNNIEQTLYNGNVKKLIIRSKYNQADLMQSMALFNGNGSATTNDAGCHSVEFTYDNRQQITERRYYNTSGKLTLIPDNVGYYAVDKTEYDRMGRPSRQTYFDTNERPTPLSLHVPEAITGYDKQGNMNYIAFADGNGKVIDNPKQGYAYREMLYNTQGYVIEERFYNIDGKLLQKCTIDYDKYGISISRKCYDANNKLLGTEKYDQKTGQVNSDYWRQYWQQTKTPIEIDYGIILTSISLASNGCTLQIQFTGISKYQQTDSELDACKNDVRQFAAVVKKDSQMPSSAQLTVIGIDKSKVELFRITY